MPTTTRASLRQTLSESIGDYWTSTTTSSIDASSVADTTLQDKIPEAKDDDGVVGWFVRLTSGSASGEIGQITAYTASTGDMTVASAFTASVANAVTFELHRIPPSLKDTAIDRACIDSWPHLYLGKRDETLVVDDLLSNGGFETFSGGFTGWTETGSPTVTAETTIVWHGSQAAKIVAGGLATMYQAPSVNVSELAGKTMTFRCRGWASASSKLRCRLDFQTGDASDVIDGSYHTGDSSWRLLTASGTVPTNATTVRAVIEVAASATAYADLARLMGDAVYKYTIPEAVIELNTLTQQYNEDDVDGPYYGFGDGRKTPTAGRLLRLEGRGHLTQPTDDTTATVEIGEPHIQLFTAYAAQFLARAGWLQTNARERDREWQTTRYWEDQISRMTKRNHPQYEPGKKMPTHGAEAPSTAWSEQEDSSGRYIYFNASRQTTEVV